MSNTPTEDQFEGCIIGCAIGDAIGAVLEKLPAQKAQAFVEHIVKTKDWDRVAKIKFARNQEWAFGQYTDDTQLSRILMLSIIVEGGFSPRDYAKRIAKAFGKGEIVGAGKATKEAAAKLIAGEHWAKTGTPAPRAGNGGAMRAAPIGLAYSVIYDEGCLGKAAYSQAYITHQAPDSLAASIVMAFAVSMALKAQTHFHPGTLDWWQELSKWGKYLFKEQSNEPSEFFLHLDTLLRNVLKHKCSEQYVREDLLRLDKSLEANKSWDGVSPWAVTSTLWALYSFMKSPDDFWQTMETALSIGGDTDSIAAMAGALSGAYNGYEAIQDPKLVPMLQDRGDWGADKLRELARALLDASKKGPR
jgi:ADP-ribosylglycohydrolase